MSQRPPISFRFSDHELEVLEREQLQSESINQTAARLLREKLGLVDVNSESTIGKQTLESWIDNAVVAKVQHMVYEGNEAVYTLVDKLSKRIDELEKKLGSKPKSTRKSTTKSLQEQKEFVNTSID